jgi:molecular chaperone DnaK
LSKDEVDRMVKEAASHASEDASRRELIDVRNQADSLAYQVEKTVNENREKLPVGELSRIEASIAEVRRLAQGDDTAAIKKAVDELQHVSHALAQTMYANANASNSGSGSGSGVKDAEVVDAEYAETK